MSKLYPLLRCRGFLPVRTDGAWEVWQQAQPLPQPAKLLIAYSPQLVSAQVGFIQQATAAMARHGVGHAIACFSKTISPPSRVKQAELAERGLQLELLHTGILSCDIFSHELQPQFQLCDRDQSKAVKRRHLHQMNQFKLSDPVVVWKQWPVGSVVAVCDACCGRELDPTGACCEAARWRVVAG